jgi:glycosyltransferase involved in cell wall biosynthesis
LKISVIFTTYNSPVWLQKVLWGWAMQSHDIHEIVIADDGSDAETRTVIEKFRNEYPITIKHVWQEDNGFQKCRILNKAILAAEGEYLVVSDGDCIPRADFIAQHRKYAEPGYFLSGGYFKLPMSTSQLICKDDIISQQCFDKEWLIENGVKPSLKFMKLTAGPIRSRLYNTLTTTKPTWNGHNASCFRSDAIRVNGFDERMRYGGEDVEFGYRLKNAGVKTKQIRYSAVCIHLDHERGYVNEADRERNRAILDKTVKEKHVVTPAGISQHASDDEIHVSRHHQ